MSNLSVVYTVGYGTNKVVVYQNDAAKTYPQKDELIILPTGKEGIVVFVQHDLRTPHVHKVRVQVKID